ncbi:hypothetical protein TNCV_3460561 [Trichonephila clavipes]|nr:hypothetical protein TNCV_3460561 [Trichonephila clavipes]
MQSGWSQKPFIDESHLAYNEIPDVFWVISGLHYRSGSLVVLAGMSLDRRIELYIIRRSKLMSQGLANEILRPHVVSYRAIIGDYFLLMQDAGNHATRLQKKILKAEIIQHLDQPACSPVLNRIQHA